MKRCPQCNRAETDEALKFCRADGTALINDSSSIDSDAGTVRLGSSLSSEIETSVLPNSTDVNINRATAPTTVLPAISTNGGLVPVWSRNGKELFYVAEDGMMMAVGISPTVNEFQFTPPKALFKTRMLAAAGVFHEFDVTADGPHFLVGTLIGDTKSPRPKIILNWPAALKK
jgi:hypothetical protein